MVASNMIIEEYQVKHVNSLIRTAYPSLFSWNEVYLNPYQGCYHDCKYCDGKSESYHMHTDFANKVKVKTNAPELLKRYFRRRGLQPTNRNEATLDEFLGSKGGNIKSSKPKFLINPGGGVCDIYQPIERKMKLTRKLLQLIYDYNVPVHILTKSNLVLRDLDLLKKINDKTYASVNFTITLADETVQKIFEPRASTTTERFEALKTLREEGIHGGVYFYPPLPFIGDSDENMEQIFTQAKKFGAEFVYVWVLTLKPGRSKKEFLNTIKHYFPHLLLKYKQLYGNNNRYGNLDHKQLKSLNLIYPVIRAFKFNYEFNIPYSPPRYIPSGRIDTNLRLSEVLLKVSYLKSCILQEKNREAYNLNKAAMYLEKCQEDIFQMNRQQYKALFIPEAANTYIIDYFMNASSSKLKQIEQEAYEKVLEKLNNLN